MIIKYCPSCSGKPYTVNMGSISCPVCGTLLSVESISNEGELSFRQKLNDNSGWNAPTMPSQPDYDVKMPPEFGNNYPSNTPFGSNAPSNYPDNSYQPSSYPNHGNEPFGYGNQSPSAPGSYEREYREEPQCSNSIKPVEQNSLVGRVTRYSSTGREDGNYRRWFAQRIYDALVYGQRTDDILHRFYIQEAGTDSLGYSNSSEIPVNVHGTISGGVNIRENDTVRVSGKFNNSGTFMAKEVYVINSGMESRINFQHSPRAIFYLILSIASVLFFLYTVLANGGSFLDNISSFFVGFIVIFIILLVLLVVGFWRIMLVSSIFGRGRFPFGGLLMLSFIIDLIFWNLIGFN